MSHVTVQLNQVRQAVADAAVKAGRPAESVRLLAVSKTFPASDIQEAYQTGQRMFGENNVQELEMKVPVLPSDIEWHLIGHLQSNKAAKAAELAHWIHSVDSEKLVRKLSAAASEKGKTLFILLEVNTSGEESKFGIRAEDELRQIAKTAVSLPGIQLKGLMTMAPAGADAALLKETFSRLRDFRDMLEKELNCTLPELSMGMSGDYPAAIAEGATIVRIGTAIFGGRDYSK